MYNNFKRINQQYRGKLFNNVINSLAKVFQLSVSTIRPVVEGKCEGKKSKQNSRKIIDDFDKEAIRHVIYEFYGDTVLRTAKMIKRNLKERNIDIGIIDRIEPVLISLSSDETFDNGDDYEWSDTNE